MPVSNNQENGQYWHPILLNATNIALQNIYSFTLMSDNPFECIKWPLLPGQYKNIRTKMK